MEHFRSPEAETDPGDAETGNAFLFLTGFFYPRFLSFSISSAAVGCWRLGVLGREFPRHYCGVVITD